MLEFYLYGLAGNLFGVLERENRSLDCLLAGEEALLNRFYFEIDFSLFCEIFEGLMIVCNAILDFYLYFFGLFMVLTSFSRL
jgi:hypothetical protein